MQEKNKNCIFCKIIGGKTDTDFIHEDERVVAFSDIDPQAPVHILIIPKKHVLNLNQADGKMMGYCMGVAKSLAAETGISEKGYRIVINCNKAGGQVVEHLHIHLLGGRNMKWPPG